MLLLHLKFGLNPSSGLGDPGKERRELTRETMRFYSPRAAWTIHGLHTDLP
jgi:hypothetical protein